MDTGKYSSHFIFVPFSFLKLGKFKTGWIQNNSYITVLVKSSMYHIFQLSGWIKDRAKQFASIVRQKKMGRK